MASKKVLSSLNALVVEKRKDALEKFSLYVKTNMSELDQDKFDQLMYQFLDTLHNDPDVFTSTKSKKKEKSSRPPTKYNLFVRSKMQELKAEFPELKNTDLMSKAASLWKENKNDFQPETPVETSVETPVETLVETPVVSDVGASDSDASQKKKKSGKSKK